MYTTTCTCKLLVEALMPIGFTFLNKFHSHRPLPEESLPLFSHESENMMIEPHSAQSHHFVAGTVVCQQATVGGQRNRITKLNSPVC